MESYANCPLEGSYPVELCEQSLNFQDGFHSAVTSNALSNLSFLNEPLHDFSLSEIESTFSSGVSDTNSRFQERYHPYSGHSSNVAQTKDSNCYGVERLHSHSLSGNSFPGYHMSEGQATGQGRTGVVGLPRAGMVHQPFNSNNNNDHCGFYSVEAYQVPPGQQSVSGLPFQAGPPLAASINFRQPRTQGFTPSGIPLRIMDTESSSSPDTEMSQETKPNEGKKRGVKKRRKRGTNEPQKPVSAYALFFRDTQAAIKAENPSATFGEISKIVASMWDSLSEEAKQVYKQKTETAKRDYLKQLASFRANLVSRGGLEGDEEDSQPLSMIKMKMNDNLPPPPKLQMAPTVAMRGFPPVENSQPNATSPVPVRHIILQPASTAASTTVPAPPPIQLRSIVPKSQSPITFLQSKPGQVIKLVPASQVATISGAGSDAKTRIIKMTDLIRPSQTNNVQPILETLADEHNTLLHDGGRDEPQSAVASNGDAEYQTNSVRVCIRDGCANLAVSDPQWNQEYCSSECVVRHCRDVFDAWTSARQVSASVN